MGKNTTIDYYNEHVKGKIHDYLYGNIRVKKAFKMLSRYLPKKMNHVLEIGCGIGYITYKLAKKFPKTAFVGLDISPKSIEIAQLLFRKKNLFYLAGELQPELFIQTFDIIFFLDVYEHISKTDRLPFLASLNKFLSERGIIVMSFPTPCYQKYLKNFNSQALQPIDESITLADLYQFALSTNTEIVYYKQIKAWRQGDYAHAVFARPSSEWTYHVKNSFFKKLTIRLIRFLHLPFLLYKKFLVYKKM